jgi:hypothetical protein
MPVLYTVLCAIIGTIPAELGACKELDFLSLASNKLEGTDNHQ